MNEPSHGFRPLAVYLNIGVQYCGLTANLHSRDTRAVIVLALHSESIPITIAYR